MTGASLTSLPPAPAPPMPCLYDAATSPLRPSPTRTREPRAAGGRPAAQGPTPTWDRPSPPRASRRLQLPSSSSAEPIDVGDGPGFSPPRPQPPPSPSAPELQSNGTPVRRPAGGGGGGSGCGSGGGSGGGASAPSTPLLQGNFSPSAARTPWSASPPSTPALQSNTSPERVSSFGLPRASPRSFAAAPRFAWPPTNATAAAAPKPPPATTASCAAATHVASPPARTVPSLPSRAPLPYSTASAVAQTATGGRPREAAWAGGGPNAASESAGAEAILQRLRARIDACRHHLDSLS
jgi:hypothetical protein